MGLTPLGPPGSGSSSTGPSVQLTSLSLPLWAAGAHAAVKVSARESPRPILSPEVDAGPPPVSHPRLHTPCGAATGFDAHSVAEMPPEASPHPRRSFAMEKGDRLCVPLAGLTRRSCRKIGIRGPVCTREPRVSGGRQHPWEAVGALAVSRVGVEGERGNFI